MNDIKNDKIELTLPINAAYVSAARLTASSISNRLGFNIDEIEEIKAAVSEACTYIVKYYSSTNDKNFHITFNMLENSLHINLCVDLSIKINDDNDDIGLCMIKALVDDFNMNFQENVSLNIAMTKNHDTSSFD